MCVFCDGGGCNACTPRTPEWFTAGKTTPSAHINNVARGLHPLGEKLSVSAGKRCGNCRHLKVKKLSRIYLKCGKVSETAGPATDVRRKWMGCQHWEKNDERED
jgi:hypothetical protein